MVGQDMGTLFTLQTHSGAQHQDIFSNKGSGCIPLHRQPGAYVVSKSALRLSRCYKAHKCPQITACLFYVIHPHPVMYWNLDF